MRLNKKQNHIFLLGFSVIIGVILLLYYSNRPRDLNVILITIDALRPDHLGCYSYKRNTSPNIDKLAKEGIKFTQAISQGSFTSSSLPSMLTSTYPSTSGVYFWDKFILLNKIVTLPQLLRSKAYKTAFISAHPIMFADNSNMFDFFKKIDGAKADKIIEEAVSWIDNNKNNRFFIWLHFMDVHDVPAPGPKERPAVLNTVEINKYVSMYDERLNYIDSQLKTMFKKLDNLRPNRSNLIIITADHGEGINEHGLFFDHSLYLWDCLIKVPLIIYYPQSFIQNKTIDCQVQLVDIAPTICDILKIKKPITFEGRPIFPFKENKIICSTCAFSEHQENNDKGNWVYTKFSVRSLDWKLIYTHSLYHKEYELYNLKNDPKELNNCVEAEKEQFKLLSSKLDEWMNRPKPNIASLTKPLDEETKKKLKSLGYLQ
jgi:arylsulfatase A-like enzyme